VKHSRFDPQTSFDFRGRPEITNKWDHRNRYRTISAHDPREGEKGRIRRETRAEINLKKRSRSLRGEVARRDLLQRSNAGGPRSTGNWEGRDLPGESEIESGTAGGGKSPK